MDKSLKNNLISGKTWLRGFFMLLFYIINYIVRVLIGLVALFQWIIVLITGRTNFHLVRFGQGLSSYAYQIFCFLTFNTESKPFPFNPWPTGPVKELPKPSKTSSSKS